jgi:hypothetical protein
MNYPKIRHILTNALFLGILLLELTKAFSVYIGKINQHPSKSQTIADNAFRGGASVPTVSRVLHQIELL